VRNSGVGLERRVGGGVAVLAAWALQHARDVVEGLRPSSRRGRDNLGRLRLDGHGGRRDHHSQQDAGDGKTG
jgi:hypothetical protein